MEIRKPIHFWNLYAPENLNTNDNICADTYIAAILDFKMAAANYKFVNISASRILRKLIQNVTDMFTWSDNVILLPD
jgi:hypothetical protein